MSGSSPWQRYSSHTDADPQPLLSRRMSSVKVEPGAPMNTLDIAHIVLSSIASTFSMKVFIMHISKEIKSGKKTSVVERKEACSINFYYKPRHIFSDCTKLTATMV